MRRRQRSLALVLVTVGRNHVARARRLRRDDREQTYRPAPEDEDALAHGEPHNVHAVHGNGHRLHECSHFEVELIRQGVQGV